MSDQQADVRESDCAAAWSGLLPLGCLAPEGATLNVRPPGRLALAQTDNSKCAELGPLAAHADLRGINPYRRFVVVNSCAQLPPCAFYALVPLRVVA